MDKSWMNKSRISREYFNGVQEFVTFASKQAPTHEKQAHHESLDVEEQLVVDVAVSGTLYVFNLIQRLILLILVDII